MFSAGITTYAPISPLVRAQGAFRLREGMHEAVDTYRTPIIDTTIAVRVFKYETAPPTAWLCLAAWELSRAQPRMAEENADIPLCMYCS